MTWKDREGREQKRSHKGPAEGAPREEGLHGQESREGFPSIPPLAANDVPSPPYRAWLVGERQRPGQARASLSWGQRRQPESSGEQEPRGKGGRWAGGTRGGRSQRGHWDLGIKGRLILKSSLPLGLFSQNVLVSFLGVSPSHRGRILCSGRGAALVAVWRGLNDASLIAAGGVRRL